MEEGLGIWVDPLMTVWFQPCFEEINLNAELSSSQGKWEVQVIGGRRLVGSGVIWHLSLQNLLLHEAGKSS